MKIKYTEALDAAHSSFGVLDSDCEPAFLVDQRFQRGLKEVGITSIESLHSFAESDPSHVQKIFNMPEGEFLEAMTALTSVLEKKSPEYLTTARSEPEKFATGYPTPADFEYPNLKEHESNIEEDK